jgi:Platelet-activating factor acetylhydrolase, isoform II
VALILLALHFAHHRRALRALHARENSADSAPPSPVDDKSSTPSADCETNTVGYRVLTVGNRPVALWYPTTAQPGSYSYSSRFSSTLAFNASPGLVCGKKVPLVVFSHGDLGCGLQSVAITEELARHGYVVAAPDHADASLCHLGITPFLEGPNGAFAAANPPVYFAVLPHAARLAWVMRLSAEYAIAFFNRYLKNIPEPILEKSNPNVAEFKFRLASTQ